MTCCRLQSVQVKQNFHSSEAGADEADSTAKMYHFLKDNSGGCDFGYDDVPSCEDLDCDDKQR